MAAGHGAGDFCTFSATGDPSLVVYVQVYANAETLAVARNEESSGQHVTGLGDDAFWTVAGNLFVQKGKRGFTITLPSLALTSRTAPPKIVTLATRRASATVTPLSIRTSAKRSIRMNRTIGSGRTVIGWRRMRLVLAASGLVLAGLAASIVPASASPAAPRAGIDSFIFTSGIGHLNGGGHKWSLTVGVEALGGGTGLNVIGFQISTPHLGGTESHGWGGQLPAGDLSANPAAVMTLNSRSSLSPVASLNLTFRPASHKTQTRDCVSGKDVVYTGTLKGSVRLDTGLKGLKLSAAHFSFGGHSTADGQSRLRFVALPRDVLGHHFRPAQEPRHSPAAPALSYLAARQSIAGIQRTVTIPGANRLGRSDRVDHPGESPDL